jgi:hypothetical protein
MNLCEEIFSIRVDGEDFRRITDNDFWDLIPNWSADDSKIFFLSFRETLDIFMMNADSSNLVEVYDSGFHDSDLHGSSGKLKDLLQSVDQMLKTTPKDIKEEVGNDIRLEMDKIVLGSLGLSKKDVLNLYDELKTLVDLRCEKADNVRKSQK